MAEDELNLSGDPDSLIESLARQRDDLSQAHHGHEGPIETVREATYRNHHIVVRTTYSITVDDVPIEGHLGVSDDGQVHYHAIPNLGFASAIDMAKAVIDTFPDDFGGSYGGGDDPAHGDGGDDDPAHGDGGHDDPAHGDGGDGGHEHGEGQS